jgi:chorismate mutase
LEKLRKQINLIDDELISILSSRMAVARDIGTYKKENNITILQSAQWQKILNKYKEKAKSHDLSDGFITRFIKAVHDESIDQQEKIFGD